ncbi:MAG: Crp/Fnr family transcriptional regulator [Bacteroidaceae bacterium]|nr:Crp/Fnr family transcriptional regulator [Bacteroidaceae bacterium]
MDSPILDTLKQLPLFQGMAADDFSTLLQKIRLDFVKYPPGSFICRTGDVCSHFTFLIGGTIESSRRGKADRFIFHERISSPHLIEPYSMFGATGSYRRDYNAVDTCSVLNVDKQYVYTEIGKYNICMMNLLNILSGRVQQADRHTWEIDECTLRHKIARFIYELSDIPYGEKRLSITMNDLAALMDATRLNVSRELNTLSADGIIALRRKEILIPALEKMT